MATACIINKYHSYSDRGAFVQKEPVGQKFIDKEQVKVGQPLPSWGYDAPMVKAYDGAYLELEYKDKLYSIKVGEELLIDESILSQNYGVTLYSLTTVKVLSTELVYKGGWQNESIVMQKLGGPKGNGKVFYPNGDHFEGFFHLNYARISGPAHAANGCYTFADGSYIEKAWINTSEDRKPECWGLHGVFRVHHPDGRESIAMFARGGRRYGLELFLDEHRPQVKEWYADEEVVRWKNYEPERIEMEVVDYRLDETSRVDCISLELTVMDRGQKYRILQEGGRYEANQFDSYVYEPSTRATVWLPNGDSIDHFGTSLREFMPYDGYVDVHCAKTGKCRQEHWENGMLVDNKEWAYDDRAATHVKLPDPTGAEGELEANVWADGHIVYGYDEWVYDGEVKDNRPNGRGVLVGDRRHGERRYEGLFSNGVYVNDEEAFDGKITLHVKSGHRHWSISGYGDWKYEEEDIVAKRGPLNLDGFWNYEITSIKQDCITIEFYEKKYEVRPGQSLHLSNEIEGREWSDGCVYDGDNYSLELTWQK